MVDDTVAVRTLTALLRSNSDLQKEAQENESKGLGIDVPWQGKFGHEILKKALSRLRRITESTPKPREEKLVEDPSLCLYDDLQIGRDAEIGAIRAAFRYRALQTHPDKTGSQDSSLFLRIVEAWEVLSNETSRKGYDAKLSKAKTSDGLGWSTTVPGAPADECQKATEEIDGEVKSKAFFKAFEVAYRLYSTHRVCIDDFTALELYFLQRVLQRWYNVSENLDRRDVTQGDASGIEHLHSLRYMKSTKRYWIQIFFPQVSGIKFSLETKATPSLRQAVEWLSVLTPLRVAAIARNANASCSSTPLLEADLLRARSECPSLHVAFRTCFRFKHRTRDKFVPSTPNLKLAIDLRDRFKSGEADTKACEEDVQRDEEQHKVRVERALQDIERLLLASLIKIHTQVPSNRSENAEPLRNRSENVEPLRNRSEEVEPLGSMHIARMLKASCFRICAEAIEDIDRRPSAVCDVPSAETHGDLHVSDFAYDSCMDAPLRAARTVENKASILVGILQRIGSHCQILRLHTASCRLLLQPRVRLAVAKMEKLQLITLPRDGWKRTADRNGWMKTLKPSVSCQLVDKSGRAYDVEMVCRLKATSIDEKTRPDARIPETPPHLGRIPETPMHDRVPATPPNSRIPGTPASLGDPGVFSQALAAFRTSLEGKKGAHVYPEHMRDLFENDRVTLIAMASKDYFNNVRTRFEGNKEMNRCLVALRHFSRFLRDHWFRWPSGGSKEVEAPRPNRRITGKRKHRLKSADEIYGEVFGDIETEIPEKEQLYQMHVFEGVQPGTPEMEQLEQAQVCEDAEPGTPEMDQLEQMQVVREEVEPGSQKKERPELIATKETHVEQAQRDQFKGDVDERAMKKIKVEKSLHVQPNGEGGNERATKTNADATLLKRIVVVGSSKFASGISDTRLDSFREEVALAFERNDRIVMEEDSLLTLVNKATSATLAFGEAEFQAGLACMENSGELMTAHKQIILSGR